MKTLKFKNEKETADMVIRLQTANAKFAVTGRTEIVVDDLEPALVLPPTFARLLSESLCKKGAQLIGVSKHGSIYNIFTNMGTISMEGSFSVDDVERKLLNEAYKVLNKRFDERVSKVKDKGLSYYKEHTCFARSEKSAQNRSGISNASIMHMDDFIFNLTLDRL